MRKRCFSLIAAGLLACSLNLACSKAPHTSDQQPAIPSPVVGQTAAEMSVTGSAEEVRFTPGTAADDGVVRQSHQIRREVRGGYQGKAASAYSHGEDRSANYLVAQHKTKSAPHQLQGGNRVAVGDKQPDPVPTPPESLSDFKAARAEPLSTFSADVDTASYANVRRALMAGRQPHADEVRVEEMINYFSYSLPEPKGGEAFSLTSEISDCPWNENARLLRLAIKTKSINREQKPPCNLVFLLDVSGSMNSPDKLPLLKSSLKTLVDTLDDADRIAIVAYAGASGLVLPSTPASQKAEILAAIDRLEAGGSTNGASGIELAYQVAEQSGAENSVNRVILATDGDFNVGVSSRDGLKKLIEEKRESGIFLSVLGFGDGGYNDSTMETLADNGNGNYASIDSLAEARKVLVEESGANLVTVAKDVKFQIDFNPKKVDRYRLIGYKNRRLANEDFANDKKDAGDLGAGHAVTVLYEIIPTEQSLAENLLSTVGVGGERLALVKLRYKKPGDDESTLREIPVQPDYESLAESSEDHRWAVAVCELGLSLDGDPAADKISMDQVTSLAQGAQAGGKDSYRAEFLDLLEKASGLTASR